MADALRPYEFGAFRNGYATGISGFKSSLGVSRVGPGHLAKYCFDNQKNDLVAPKIAFEGTEFTLL